MTGTDGTDTLPMVRRRHQRRQQAGLLVAAMVVAAAGCGGGLPTPSRDAAQAQTMLDLAETLNQIRDQSAGLQEQVDSLRETVVRQDTIIHQLALAAGISIKPQ